MKVNKLVPEFCFVPETLNENILTIKEAAEGFAKSEQYKIADYAIAIPSKLRKRKMWFVKQSSLRSYCKKNTQSPVNYMIKEPLLMKLL